MIILYIPFTFDGAIVDLTLKAERWLKDYQSKGKDTIIVYHGGLASEKKKPIEKALETGDCQIYILGHGKENSELMISNQAVVDEYSKTLSIQEVAAHFQQDLMFAHFSNQNVVKLFFCDVYGQDEKSKEMAEAFRECLGKPHQSLDVNYYTDVCVSTQQKPDSQLRTKKGVRHVQITNPVFSFQLQCIVGSAKSFRQGLNEAGNPNTLFLSSTSKPQKITYPKYSHHFIRQLAEILVHAIQSDKILSQQQDSIISELLPLLPNKLSNYLVDGFQIEVENFVFEMKINKQKLLQYYMAKADISLPEKGTSIFKAPANTFSWVRDFSETPLPKLNKERGF